MSQSPNAAAPAIPPEAAKGLTESEAQKRLEQYGPNEIPEAKSNALLKILSYFWGPIPWMIEAAAALSAAIRDWEDFGIIGALLLVNGLVRFWEEHQAENAVAALKEQLSQNARVLRDGQWKQIPARDLVADDVVRLHIGDIVPADVTLIGEGTVDIDQSALTGESLPVTAESGSPAYSSSIIKRGETEALVTGTGVNTYFGKTTTLVEKAHTVSHFQRAVIRIGDYLIVIALVMVTAVLVVAVMRGNSVLKTLTFAMVLAVASVPVALPAVLSVTMAIGSRKLATLKAVVTRLSAIEEMGGIDVLCTDKTGTVTENELTTGDPYLVPQAGETPDGVFLAAALTCRGEDQDQIDLAVLERVKDRSTLDAFQVTDFKPFDPVAKRAEATVVAPGGARYSVTKGAPQVILQLAKSPPDVSKAVLDAVEQFASKGYRALGVARTDEAGNWTYLGVIPLFDPPRADAAETIQAAEAMGVSVKMLTGDQIAIAKEVAGKIGLGTTIYEAEQVDHTGTIDHAAADLVEKADGFAQVFPEHKFRIVQLLQRRDHIVGMTGDGVNDAPALKQADAGIAVSRATDAARAAADIVLLAPGLSVIIDAIRESRRIFTRMTNYAIYRVAETIRVLLFMSAAILAFNFFPVTAAMIVLLAVLNDGAILSIAFDNVTFAQKPERWNMQVVLGVATALGLLGVIETFGLFFLADKGFHINHDVLQSMMYLKLSVAGHLTVFVARTRGPFWSVKPARILLFAVIGTQIVATLIATYGFLMTPLGWKWAGFVWIYAFTGFFVEDATKLLAYRVLDTWQRRSSERDRTLPSPAAAS